MALAVPARQTFAAFIVLLASSATSSPAEDQELRLTETLLSLDMAQAACGLRIAQPALARLLSAAGVTREQLYGRPITPALQATINAMQMRFTQNVASACAEAWRRYGPSSDVKLLAR